jgi:hypothetical protein
MSRQPYQWTPEQLKRVERLWYDNVAKHVIAEDVGVSYNTLQFHLECGELCHLPKRRQGSGMKKTNRDDEAKGILFGVPDWKERAEAVRRGWGVAENYRRRHGHVE